MHNSFAGISKNKPKRQISYGLNLLLLNTFSICHCSQNGKRKTSHTKSGAKPKNWAELDFKLLPQVKQILLNCQGTIDIRPTRITIGRISKELNISIYTLKRLPKSMQLINDNIETIEQYFAREIIWAYNNCLKDNTNITLTNICKRINIRKYQFKNSLIYLPHYTDNKTIEHLYALSN